MKPERNAEHPHHARLSSEIEVRAKRLDQFESSAESKDPAVLSAALRELREQHEELKAAEQELDEIRAVHREALDDRARYRLLFENAPVAYLVTSAAGVIHDANKAAVVLFAVEERSLRGKPLTVFVDPADTRRVRDLLKGISAGRSETTEVRLRRRNGDRFWASLSCVVTDHGTRLLWTVTELSATVEDDSPAASDVAELQRALRDTRDLLARERRLRQQVEQAERAKDRFIAVLSHDLRAPINAVLGWTDLLRREILGKDARDRALATIERSARAQLGLVEELLDLSRIATDRLRLELVPLDITKVAERVVESAMPLASEAGVRLTCSTSENAAIFGDRVRIEQVLTNLVGNALKFTPSGGSVDVSVAREDRDVVVRVRDTGLGIKATDLPHVFECFHQDGNNDGRSGLGLGLYIVRHLVELHGGSVEAESEGEGQGACFVVRLPSRDALATTEADLDTRPEQDVTQLDGVRVLVVDDEDDARELMSMILVHRGAHVAVAGDASTAAAMFETCAPDIVVSDVAMPGEDGLSLLRRLRALAPDLPAVAISGFAGAEDAANALAAGFDIHVAKPVEPARLVAAVRELYDLRRTRTR